MFQHHCGAQGRLERERTDPCILINPVGQLLVVGGSDAQPAELGREHAVEIQVLQRGFCFFAELVLGGFTPKLGPFQVKFQGHRLPQHLFRKPGTGRRQ